MEIKEAQLLILQDIISHYNLTNRSTDGTMCLYNGPNNSKCAAGRWMTCPEKATEGEKVSYIVNSNLLKPEAHLASEAFMSRMQVLHDNGEHWNEVGLTTRGIEYVQSICEHNTLDFFKLNIKPPLKILSKEDGEIKKEASDMITKSIFYSAEMKPGSWIKRWGKMFPNIAKFTSEHFNHRIK